MVLYKYLYALRSSKFLRLIGCVPEADLVVPVLTVEEIPLVGIDGNHFPRLLQVVLDVPHQMISILVKNV
jgi:hypothetical protein